MHGSFTILGIEFPSYFTFLMLGLMAGFLYGTRKAPLLGLDQGKVLDLCLVLLVSGLAGGRLAHVLFDGQLDFYYWLCVDPLRTKGELLPSAGLAGGTCTDDAQCVAANVGELCSRAAGTCHWSRDCFRVLKFWYGGMTYYGGLLLAMAFGIRYLRKHQIPVWRVGDLAGMGIPLGVGIGRLGCFLAGCCYGGTADVPWAVSFPNGSAAWKDHFDQHLVGATDGSLPVHPTQLYEAALCFSVFLFGRWWFHRKRTFDGEIFWLTVLMYAAGRFAIERIRGDERGVLLGLAPSETISLGLLVTSLIMLWLLARRPQSPMSTASSETV